MYLLQNRLRPVWTGAVFCGPGPRSLISEAFWDRTLKHYRHIPPYIPIGVHYLLQYMSQTDVSNTFLSYWEYASVIAGLINAHPSLFVFAMLYAFYIRHYEVVD